MFEDASRTTKIWKTMDEYNDILCGGNSYSPAINVYKESLETNNNANISRDIFPIHLYSN